MHLLPRMPCRIWFLMGIQSRYCTQRWPRRIFLSKGELLLIQMLMTKTKAFELVEIIRMLVIEVYFLFILPSTCLGTTWVGYTVPPVPMPASAPVPAPNSYVPVQNNKDNPPRNTLFLGNLGENINEEELRGLFSAQPGFKQMKVLRQERHTVCFIEFDDVNSATNVHRSLQGAVIPSSGSVGMSIQYSKNPFGRRKDSINPAVPLGVNAAPAPMNYQ